MTDYVNLGNAIKTTFEADSWLGNSANVKTIETHRRGFNIQDEKDAWFFAPGDLPALAIVPNAAPKKQNQETTNEIQEIIKSHVLVVTRNRNAQTGMTQNQEVVKNVERVLEKQKSSADNLGVDAYVRKVSTKEEQVKKGTYFYFISTTEAEIELTANF